MEVPPPLEIWDEIVCGLKGSKQQCCNVRQEKDKTLFVFISNQID